SRSAGFQNPRCWSRSARIASDRHFFRTGTGNFVAGSNWVRFLVPIRHRGYGSGTRVHEISSRTGRFRTFDPSTRVHRDLRMVRPEFILESATPGLKNLCSGAADLGLVLSVAQCDRIPRIIMTKDRGVAETLR